MLTDQKALVVPPRASIALPRIALVCDLVEENWPSMDLVADMLLRYLEQDHVAEFEVSRICPPMRAHFRRVPVLGRHPVLYNADRLLSRFYDYPRWLRRRVRDFDLFHVVDHSYAQLVHDLPPERTVLTCHDLDTFRCLLEPDREQRPRWYQAMTARILDGFKQVAHVIAVSAATREAILRQGLVSAERVSVIPNGVHPSCSPLPDEAADGALRELLPVDPAGALWLLNVGSSMPRKRLDLLLRVFAAVRAQLPQVLLLRVGGALNDTQRRLAIELGINDAVIELPVLSREMLAAVYRRAHLLLHTAEAEGFGLPVVEAMACGCPVVASDLPVLREVGGDAAVYCPVAAIDVWSQTVVGLLEECTESGEYWSLRRERGISNASRFSWRETVRQTAGIYKAVLQ